MMMEMYDQQKKNSFSEIFHFYLYIPSFQINKQQYSLYTLRLFYFSKIRKKGNDKEYKLKLKNVF